MTVISVFWTQYVLMLFFAFLAVKYYLRYASKNLDKSDTLFPLVAMHIIRVIGLIYFIPFTLGMNVSTLPTAFLTNTAYGDLAAAVLAAISAPFLLAKKDFAFPLVWIFNIVGFLDFIIALGNNAATSKFLTTNIGIAWFLPAFLVPIFLVSHIAIFYVLIKYPKNNNKTV